MHFVMQSYNRILLELMNSICCLTHITRANYQVVSNEHKVGDIKETVDNDVHIVVCHDLLSLVFKCGWF